MGQLGLGDRDNRHVPVRLTSLPKIQAISAGNTYSYFVDEEGGVLRTSSAYQSDCKIVKVEGLPPIKYVSHRNTYTLFMDFDGSVWSSGYNRPIVHYWVQSHTVESVVPVSSEEKFIAISVGDSHSLFLTEDGRVFVFGKNNSYQLGLPQNAVSEVADLTLLEGLPQISIICAGPQNSIFIDTEGGCWVCGNNKYGELTASEKVPTKIALPPLICRQEVTYSSKSARKI